MIAEHLSDEEVAGIKEGFKLMDINNKGKINIDELRVGLQKIGQQITDADLQILMDAVSIDSLKVCLEPPFKICNRNRITFIKHPEGEKTFNHE